MKFKIYYRKKDRQFEEVKKYIDKYKNDLIVIKCGGSVLIDPKYI